jgi:hypothetical protein
LDFGLLLNLDVEQLSLSIYARNNFELTTSIKFNISQPPDDDEHDINDDLSVSGGFMSLPMLKNSSNLPA